MDKSLKHLLIWPTLKLFWKDQIIWYNSKNIRIQSLSDVDKILGLWSRNEDSLLLNHLIIILKQYTCYFRNNTSRKPYLH